MSSREFNQATGAAKIAARNGPVYITNRGRLSHVLLSYDHYQLLTANKSSLADTLCNTPGVSNVDLEIPARDLKARPVILDY
ncbi:MAG: hypothetical protein OXI96_08550 [Acidimicrobiaceae bacterium]|nr:hypothetical protein [Acidimicrobiaceae bacterium]